MIKEGTDPNIDQNEVERGEDVTNIGYWEQVLKAPTEAYAELFRDEHAFILENIQPGSKVLDIGCGEGRNMRSMLTKTDQVYGVDIDPKAVKDARENLKEFVGVRVELGGADNLPFEDGSFDTASLLMILPNIRDIKQVAFKEAARVLRPGGKLLVTTFSDTAFDERMKIYKKVQAPIEKIEGTTVIFHESLGANTSEQHSEEDIEKLAHDAGLRIEKIQRSGDLGLHVVLRK